ncbi:hypothetical protein METHP14_200029 [Pseudomonas sp. P14-2025]
MGEDDRTLDYTVQEEFIDPFY